MTKKKSTAVKLTKHEKTKPASPSVATGATPAAQTESTSPAEREPKPAAQTKAAKPKRVAQTKAKPAAQTKAVSRSTPTDETPDELLDRGEKSKRLAKREAALAEA